MQVSSFSIRIIGITLLAVSLTALAVNTLSVKEHRTHYLQTSFQNLDALTDNLTESLLSYLGSSADIPGIATTLLQLDRHSSTLFATVYDKNEQVLFHYVNPHTTELENSNLTDTIAQYGLGTFLIDDLIISNKLIGDNSYSVGRLLVIQDHESSLKSSETSYLKKVIPLFFIIAAIVGLLAFALQRRVLQKLNLVTSFVSNINLAGNKSARLNVDGKDEICMLSRAINEYLDTIETYEHRITRQLEHLEENKTHLETLANYDTLTNLPNRKLLLEMLRVELAKHKRQNADMSILYFDIDHFKQVNDTLGHDIGDMLLKEVGHRIRQTLREGDVVARLGGDEFVILLINNENDVNARGESEYRAAQRIIDALKKPVILSKWEIITSISIGIASARQANYDADLLIRNADIAMYQAKQQSRGCYAFYEDEMHRCVQRRHDIANSILRAINQHELYVVYQPKLNKQKSVTGFEALLRWNHPVLGVISPAEFIEVAEKTGKINELTNYVIDSVIADFTEISPLFSQPVSVAINLSVFNLINEQFTEQLLAKITALPKYQERFEFEITESAYLNNFNVVNKFLHKLHNAGCSVALDDFGTGYSSLSYLTRLSIDLLKIDRSFIANIENGAADKLIVASIIQLSKSLNIAVCAEGVETLNQFNMLCELGCEFYQGYHFYKPMNLKTLIEVFSENAQPA